MLYGSKTSITHSLNHSLTTYSLAHCVLLDAIDGSKTSSFVVDLSDPAVRSMCIAHGGEALPPYQPPAAPAAAAAATAAAAAKQAKVSLFPPVD